MSSSGGAAPFKTIWELSPAELEVLKRDVKGYLDGLQATHITFQSKHYPCSGPLAIFSCLVISWLWVAVSALTGTTVSSVLAARLWAVYERDRRVLAALIIGYFVCFVPGWALAFTIGAKFSDPNQARIMGNVMTYIGGVSMQGNYDALDWRLKKCYRFPFSKFAWSIIIGAVLYESGIFLALIYKMYRDQKLTRIIEAFYRDGIGYYLIILSNYAVTLGAGYGWNTPVGQGFAGSAFYIGIKSMTCSHIILRLRSYFSLGDPVVDGHVETDPFDKEGKMLGETTSSSFVSTIILFAQMISGASGGTYEIRSTHLSRGAERQTRDLEGIAEEVEGRDGVTRREQPDFNFRVTSPTLPSSSPSSPRHSLDWTSNPNPHSQRPRLDDPTLPRQSDVVVGPSEYPSSPPHSNRPRWFNRQPGGPDQATSGGNRHSGSFGTSRYFATLRSWNEQPSVVEMDDLAGVSQNVETTRRSIGYADPLEQPPELPPSRPPDASQSGAHHRHPHPRREGSGD